MNKKYVLIPDLINENNIVAKLPREVLKVTECFVSKQNTSNQSVDYNSRLIIGRDFYNNNGKLVFKNVDQIKDKFIIIENTDPSLRICKICRRENSTQFCSQCGSYIY